jgi:Skp family chaperone for outer membrane proteins
MNSCFFKACIGSVFCFMLSFIVAVPTHAADIKLAKVSLETVFNNSTRVKAAAEEIKKMQSDANAKLGAMRAQIMQLQERLKDEKSPLKKEEKEKAENDLKLKTEEIANEQQSLQTKLNFKERSLQNVFRTQIKSAVEKIAKEEGLTAVFSEQAMVFSGDLPDLSEKVTKAFDAMPAIEKQQQQ